MKPFLSLFFLFAACGASGQQGLDFDAIDRQVRYIEASSPDSLAKKLTAPYHTEREKVRAIFSWIAQHISYNTGFFNAGKKSARVKYAPDPFDTASSWKSGDELTAEKVLRKRMAVCDGYAKLFKSLCDHGGLQAVIISGYAKCDPEHKEKFHTNHSWNAVKIDSAWHLLDATGGSGYVTYANEFVPLIDEAYFLSPPKQFILDHYPEDLRWTLLDAPPTLAEFQFTPFKNKSFGKYSIRSFSPSRGIIEAAVGDTVRIELGIGNAGNDRKISMDPFFDSTILVSSPASVFLQPSVVENKALYTYVVDQPGTEWIHLMYNKDMVLRYRLHVKKGKAFPLK
jgi:hypothetical protein